MTMIPIETHWTQLVASFKDRRTLTMLFYEALFIIVVAVILLTLNSHVGNLASKVLELGPISPADTRPPTSAEVADLSEVAKIQISYAVAVLISAILVLLALLSSRLIIYSKALGKKLTWAFYGKNLLVTILTSAVAAGVIYVLQAIVLLIVLTTTPSRPVQVLIYVLVSLFLMLLAYLMMNYKLRFVREQAFIKGTKAFFRENIVGIKRFLVPFCYTAVIFLFVNLAFFIFMFIPGNILFLIVFTIFLVLYIAWLRTYYLRLMESDLAESGVRKHPAKKKKKRTTRKK